MRTCTVLIGWMTRTLWFQSVTTGGRPPYTVLNKIRCRKFEGFRRFHAVCMVCTNLPRNHGKYGLCGLKCWCGPETCAWDKVNCARLMSFATVSDITSIHTPVHTGWRQQKVSVWLFYPYHKWCPPHLKLLSLFHKSGFSCCISFWPIKRIIFYRKVIFTKNVSLFFRDKAEPH